MTKICVKTVSINDTGNLGKTRGDSHLPTPRILSVIVVALMTQSAVANTKSRTDGTTEAGTDMSITTDMPKVTFDKIVVASGAEMQATQATEDIKTSQDIKEQQIDNLQDLVRYNTDVSVAEIGRYGNKGFAMRGVDGNRIALSLDGVNLPDRQVNEIFSRYGNMYEGRFSPELEMLSEIRLQVGADSFKSGSGAVGGAVNYKTKDPDDLLQSNEQIGGYAKLSYADANEEFTKAVGLAGRNEQVEAIINYVRRDGHELKNHRMIDFDADKLKPSYDFDSDPNYPNIYPVEASLPDPLDYKSESALAKVYWHINDEHRLGVQGIYQKRDSLSNNYSTRIASYTKPPAKMGRDETELKSYALNYRYLPNNSEWIDQIKADISHQQITAIARTEDHRNIYGSEDYYLDKTEYRPQTDKTNQLHIEGLLYPIETQKLGTHTLSLDAQYAKADHDLILQTQTEYGDWYTFVGPAVKRDVFNIAVEDKIDVTNKLSTTLGLRYDDYAYKPYITKINKKALAHQSGESSVKQYYENGDFEKKQRMDNLGAMVAVNYKLNPQWQLGYKFSTGFLAPATSQMYSAFEILGNKLTPNPNLKPETSKNHELTLAADYDNFSVSATGFYSDYEDFIQFMQFAGKDNWANTVNLIGAQNIGQAQTYGLRLGGTWDVSDYAGTEGSVRLSGNLSFAKDETERGINLLATEPLGAQLGIHYESPDQGYKLHSSVRYLGAKKAEDAKVFADTNKQPYGNPIYGIAPFELINHSKSTVIYDVYGSKQLTKGLTLSAGVFNVFNETYIPWSSLRSLAEVSINSSLGREGAGIERYTAPGRNYKVGLTYQF
ncbi:TonB-dependent hemoglobin/transferrin/lactoferrin family receptor [Psychrobacter phenylpyruvicus]|uniref:Heme-repressible hemoglobin-binding protein n=1 Tax=Psychrobacter phenylpyruvicus TaxID=29432 RepID=A0A379LL92_9GAMM|nr:TonB-dependent hemoglobin/transferrin/lactoferrin family receptor [Psychrobacter phenylpyruvicus]SUD90544.1 Heme-repressible hemoglobin-binding protein [Psychrobacter phenylpyruvicus]